MLYRCTENIHKLIAMERMPTTLFAILKNEVAIIIFCYCGLTESFFAPTT